MEQLDLCTNKRVLIISPYFPPTNAADMQRVRMSLPFFKDFGWDPEVVTVDPRFSDMATDDLLTQTVPSTVQVHIVKAFSKRWTSKIGLGSIAIRSIYFYHQKVAKLLKTKHFDLVFFSTTQFPVCALGRYWKARFGVPYLIDIQDLWHSNYHKSQPKRERPPKYWFSYWLNRTLEPLAMKRVDGLMAVSAEYLKTLSQRYPHCRNIPQETIPFGLFSNDFDIAKKNGLQQPSVLPHDKSKINIVYIGRGGKDMQVALSYLFQAFQFGLGENFDKFNRIQFYFIGTSYAAAGKGISTVLPIAEEFNILKHVTEMTDRLPFYQTLNTLQDADALFVPGSDDPQYTASKIYPYVMAKKPLLAVFNKNSSAVSFLKRAGVGTVITFDKPHNESIVEIKNFIRQVVDKKEFNVVPEPNVINEFSANRMTKNQCVLFEKVVNKFC